MLIYEMITTFNKVLNIIKDHCIMNSSKLALRKAHLFTMYVRRSTQITQNRIPFLIIFLFFIFYLIIDMKIFIINVLNIFSLKKKKHITMFLKNHNF